MEDTFSASIDRLKESFLWAAAQGGNSQDCESLIDIGADINWKNADGDTPLLAACRRGHVETMTLLLAKGADSNAIGGDSMSPLHVCARRGDSVGLNVLLESNANTALKTREGLTALDIAKSKGYENIYGLLMRQRRVVPAAVASSSSRQLLSFPLPVSRQLSLSTASTDLLSLPITTGISIVGEPTITVNSQFPTSDGQQQQLAAADGHGNIVGASVMPQSKKKTVSKIHESAVLDNLYNNEIDKEGKSKQYSSQKDRSTPLLSTGGQYTLIGGGGANFATINEDEATTALKSILDKERSIRINIESKLDIFKKQNSEMLLQLHSLSQQLSVSQLENQVLQTKMDKFLCKEGALDRTSIEELENIEKDLKRSLDIVEAKKAILIRDRLEIQKEQRQCVVCQEREKCVVLLPCRHLCLCEPCSKHDQLKHCPLCRQEIAHRIGVFA